MSKKYTKQSEQELIKAIREIGPASGKVIAVGLNDLGLKNAQGTVWTGNSVNFFTKTRRRAITGARRKATTVRKSHDGGLSVITSLVTDPNLNNTQRVRMIATYLNVTYAG